MMMVQQEILKMKDCKNHSVVQQLPLVTVSMPTADNPTDQSENAVKSPPTHCVFTCVFVSR